MRIETTQCNKTVIPQFTAHRKQARSIGDTVNWGTNQIDLHIRLQMRGKVKEHGRLRKLWNCKKFKHLQIAEIVDIL